MEPAGLSLKALLAAVALALVPMALQADEPALQLVRDIPLPAVKGRIDHLAADTKGHRVFVAALGNDTLEVIDTQGDRHRSLAGFAEPQGVAYVPESDRLFVANGRGDRVDLLDASSLTVLARAEGLDDADNVRHDAASRTVLAGYGKGALAILDGEKGTLAGRIPLPGHPESFQIERNGPRVFVNVPAARKIVVVDRVKRATVASWDLPDAGSNYPMALDESGRRLFVGARLPAVMLVLDIDSGKTVARVPIGGDTDDVFFDAQRKRVYVICGEGRVDVFRQEGADRYVREASIETAPRARTGLFVPEESRLFVAAPASGGRPARILVYRVR